MSTTNLYAIMGTDRSCGVVHTLGYAVSMPEAQKTRDRLMADYEITARFERIKYIYVGLPRHNKAREDA